ncbi:MAG: hypothetical protein V4736_03165 [Bdellovibrionota bacterium]
MIRNFVLLVLVFGFFGCASHAPRKVAGGEITFDQTAGSRPAQEIPPFIALHEIRQYPNLHTYYSQRGTPMGSRIFVHKDVFWELGASKTRIGIGAGQGECFLITSPAPNERVQRVLRAGSILDVTSEPMMGKDYYSNKVIKRGGTSKIAIELACNTTIGGLATQSVQSDQATLYVPTTQFYIEEINFQREPALPNTREI